MSVLDHTHALRASLATGDVRHVAHAIAEAVAAPVVPVDTVAAALDWMADQPHDAIAVDVLTLAQTRLGRVALALSGGASLGFFHMGVIKALHDNNALPDLISGSSIGAMVAAGIAVRDDDELNRLFTDLHRMRRDGIALAGLRKTLSTGAVLCSDQLRAVLTHNIGDWTFAEAHARTGRTLVLTVSPTKRGLQPRLLAHNTAPHTTILDSVLASAALPGLFPAARLRERRPCGTQSQTDERWADGSLRHDIPRERLIAEHGAGWVIASQTNLHVLPFVAGGRVMKQVAKSRGAARQLLRLPRRLSKRTPLAPSMDHLHDLVAQNYGGDLDIVPRMRAGAIARIVRNPTLDELRTYVSEGERATLPHLASIQRQLRLRRVLDNGLVRLTPIAQRAAK